MTTFLFMFRGHEKDKSFKSAIKFFYSNKKESLKIIELITEASIEYINNQIDSGIDCFQLFETYCGIIPSETYAKLFLPFSKRILNAAKARILKQFFFRKTFQMD